MWENEIGKVKIIELTVNNNQLKAAILSGVGCPTNQNHRRLFDTATRPNIVRLRNL
jgi:hypothetical protein